MRKFFAMTMTEACVTIGMLMGAMTCDPGQHNNQWVGVNIGGSLFAIPADQYEILSVLTDIDRWQMTPNNAAACADLAILICGEGRICCFCFSGNSNQSCSYSCWDEHGDCQPCPECGPDAAGVQPYGGTDGGAAASEG